MMRLICVSLSARSRLMGWTSRLMMLRSTFESIVTNAISQIVYQARAGEGQSSLAEGAPAETGRASSMAC